MSKNTPKTSLNYIAYRNRQTQQGIIKMGTKPESLLMSSTLMANRNLQTGMRIGGSGTKINESRRSQSTLTGQRNPQKQRKQDSWNEVGVQSFIRSRQDWLEQFHGSYNSQAGKKYGAKLRNRSICKMMSLRSLAGCAPPCKNQQMSVQSNKVGSVQEDSALREENFSAVKENETAAKKDQAGLKEEPTPKQASFWESKQIIQELSELISHQSEAITSFLSPLNGPLTELSPVAIPYESISYHDFSRSVCHNSIPTLFLPNNFPPENVILKSSIQDEVEQTNIAKNSSTPCFLHREQKPSKGEQLIKSDEELTAQTAQVNSQAEPTFERSISKGVFVRSGQISKSKSRSKLQRMLLRFKTKVNE